MEALGQELFAQVLEALAERSQTQIEGDGLAFIWVVAVVRLVCRDWQRRHGALVMRLVFKRRMTDEAVGMLMRRFPAVASVQFKWAGLEHKVTDEGVRAMSLNHHGCYKETIDGLNCLRCCRAPLTSLTLPDGEDGIQYTRAGSVCLRHAQRRARPS